MRNISSTALLFALILLSVATPAWSDDKDNVAAELAKMEGTYAFTSIERNGELPPPEILASFKSIRVVIKGTKMTMTKEGEKAPKEQEISIDPTKSPKQIDITRFIGEPKTKRTAVGIYELNGKILKICADDSGKTRPTEFATKGKKLVSTITFERE